MFAECCVFNKQSRPPSHCDPLELTEQVLHSKRRTFSRSYGAILPSSFTQVISNALVFSTCPPVSVSGTVELNLSLSDFSWKLGICFFVTCYSNSYSCLRVNRVPDLPKTPSYTLKLGLPTPSKLSLLRHHFAVKFSTGILTRFPSTTLLSLALGADSPCAD